MNKKLVCAVPLAATAAFGLYGDDDHHDINEVKCGRDLRGKP